MKKAGKIALIVFTVLAMMILWGYLNIWRSPKYFLETNICDHSDLILPSAGYGALAASHARPFIIREDSVLVYGSEHSKDPDDPQNETIEDAFNTFSPTVVVVEGRLGFLIPYCMDPITKFGEMGKAAQLARRRNLPVYSWDAPKSEQLTELLETFDPEQLALKEILNPYFSNLRFGKPDSPERYVEASLDRAAWVGVQDQITSVSDIDRIWQRDFPLEDDWRDTNDQWELPGYLSEIAEASNDIRNQHLLCVIKTLVSQGERVFVICGSSHAVCLQNAFL